MTPRHTFAETGLECWGRSRNASTSSREPDAEEWGIFSEQIQEYFRCRYENYPDDFYFWNNFRGDRTLDLKIVKPPALTARLFSDLQKYLQTHGQDMWRIRIPISLQTDDCHRMIVIYAHSIDIPPISEETAGWPKTSPARDKAARPHVVA